jgi:signal transduction histidine kinase
MIQPKIVYPQAAQRVVFKQFFAAEAIARMLFALLMLYAYPIAGVLGLIGGGVSFVLSRSANRVSLDLLVAGFGVNWTLFLIVLNYLFGWQAGFYLYASCLVFAVLLFSHIALRTRIILAGLPILGTIVIVTVTSLFPPFYELPESLVVVVNLANATLSIVLNLGILIYFVRLVQDQQEQLAEEVKVRERLITDLSHEMKTPIAAMLTRTQVQLLVEPLPEKAEAAFETIQRNLRGMKRLLNRMLELTTLDLGQRSVETALFDPEWLLRECIDLHQPLAGEKRIRFVCEYETSGEWRSDPDLLRVVINNLLSNAIRHSPNEGKIYLSCREAQDGQDDSYGTISVRDEGPGIPEEHLPRIFEPFFRGSQERSRQENAHGLGLSIAQRVVSLLGGRIEVINKPSRGAEFVVRL